MSCELELPKDRILPSGVLPVFCRLSRRSIDDVFAIEQENPHPSWGRSAILTEFSVPHAHIFGVRMDGMLRAYAIVHIVGTEAHLLNIVVCQNSRRMGLGQFFLKELMRFAFSEGARSIFLEVRRSNEAAQRLYNLFGFYTVAVRERYYRDNQEDAFVLQSQINVTILSRK